MGTKQVNLKVPENFYALAQRYSDRYGYRNIQDLALESMREKIFENSEFDETFTKQEIELIDTLLNESVKKKKLVSEKKILDVLQA